MSILISGATRGIGRAIAEKAAQKGHDLILLARNKTQLLTTQKALEVYSVRVSIIAIDLSKKEELIQLENSTIDLSNISTIVNNLGIYSLDAPTEVSKETVHRSLENNFYSAVELSRIIIPHLIQKKSGLIINIGSVMGINASADAASYSISKHAFKAWSDSLREELRSKGIRVSSIYPGAVNTSSWDGIAVDRKQMIQVEDIANIVATIIDSSANTLIEEVRISPRDFNP